MDLSKVLGDVYEADDTASFTTAAPPAPVPAPAPAVNRAPEWADEERLDRAFASWTPGPPADAPAAEREYAYAAPAPARARLDEMLAATEVLTADTAAYEMTAVVAPPPPPPAYEAPAYPFTPTYGSTRQWVRGDDDIVSSADGARSARRGLSLRRRP